MNTNAASLANAAALAAANKGTFTSLIITKQGKEVGGTVYGDDTVCTVVVTGFKYDRLVQRSLDKALTLTDADLNRIIDGKTGYDGRGKNAVERLVTLADARDALAELVTSFRETLAGTNESTTDHVFTPLVVTDDHGNAETVRGARVYKCVADDPNHVCRCRTCTGDNRAPVDGQINLSGLAIGTTVLTPAANGPAPAVKSGVKTVAKDAIRSVLPVSRYVSYRLDPNASWILKAGGAAVVQADTNGVHVQDSALSAMAA
jgi:hypothetical protein